jgi:hypothetical protein
MGSLQGPVICPVVCAKQSGLCSVRIYTPSVKATNLFNFGGLNGLMGLMWLIKHICEQTRLLDVRSVLHQMAMVAWLEIQMKVM